MDENQNNDPAGSAPDPETPGPDAPGPQAPGPQAPRPQAGPRVDGSEMRDLGRLRRSTTDRHVAGVAGGLARHFDIDPLIVRIAFVVLTFFGGAGIILYAAGWVLVPEDTDARAPFDLDPRTRSFVLIGVAAVAGLSILGDATDNGPGVWFPIPLIVVGGIVWLVLSRRNRRRERRAAYAATYGGTYAAPGYAGPAYAPPGYVPTGVGAQLAADAKADPEKYHDMAAWQVVGEPSTGYRWQRDPRKRGPKLFWIALPLIALALGALGVVDLAGTDVIEAAYPALALGIVAALLLLGAFWGRAGGLILLGLLLLPITAAATAAGEFDHDTLTYKPASYSEIPEFGYRLGAGEMVIDLTALDPQELDGKRLEVNMDFGRTEVIVPDGVDVQATAWIHGPGGYDLFGTEGGGIGTEHTVSEDGGVDVPTFTVDVENGFGEIEVHTASEANDGVNRFDRFDRDDERDEDR